MEWGILAVTVIFVVVGYVVLQGTRASIAWRKAASSGDVEVIRQILEDAIASWRSARRPKEIAPDVWRGVQSVALVDAVPGGASVSCQVESDYRLLDGRWLEVSSPLQEGFAVTACLADMLLYDVPNLRLDSVRIDVHTTFRDAGGTAERACILTTNVRRELAREVGWEEWTPAEIVDAFGGRYRPGGGGVAFPLRPGHADLAGAMKYGFDDVRDVLERASARETAARVAAGAVCRRLLEEFGVAVHSHTVSIGEVRSPPLADEPDWAAVEESPVRCADADASARMVRAIDAAREAGDTLGGAFEMRATGVPIGLGSHVMWDRKLDGLLAQAGMSIHAVKGVEGAGGGATPTGEPVVVRGALKPISTLSKPLPSVDLITGEEIRAHYERSDVCTVPAAGVVGEAMVAIVLAQALLEKFGGDNLSETHRNFEAYVKTIGPRGG